MQYLVNKTKSVVSSFLSPKVGAISLMPYEAIPVNVEQWDALAFSSVRNNPTIMGIYDRIPKEYAEKRKAFLAVDGVEINSAKQKEIEEAKKVVDELKATAESQKAELEETYKALNEIEMSILDTKNNLPENEKELKKVMKALDKQEKDFAKAREVYDNKVNEFQALLTQIQEAEDNVNSLTKDK